MVAEKMKGYPQFVIYGAQVVAYGAYKAIDHLYSRVPECFVVSSMEGNPTEIEGIPVRVLDELSSSGDILQNTLIILAVTELLQDEITTAVRRKGYYNIFRLTAREEHLLMSKYYKDMGLFPPAEKVPGCKEAELTLYEVRHHMDKNLNHPPKLRPWEIPVQAGAELTRKQLCECGDNSGDNISFKNKQYCEASVMYWIWKNGKTPWVGLEHYRRHLLICPDMLTGDTDVIMPLPYICYPNIHAQYSRFVGEDVAEVLYFALEKLYPEEYPDYLRCLQGKYHYAYNMIAAKSQVFGDYCQWAFSITDYIESLGLESIRNSRALAYMVEQLTSIYFIANIKEWNIKHAEKAIYT